MIKAENIHIMIISAVLFVTQLFLTSFVPAEVNGVKQEPVQRKIRGGFMGVLDMPILAKMGQNGMNTAIVWFNPLEVPVSDKQLHVLEDWSRDCKYAGLDFMPCIVYCPDEQKRFHPKYCYVINGTKYENTPCPLEADTFKYLIYDKFVALATLSKTVNIAGGVLDTEMYGADFISYRQACHCDYCWGQFRQRYSTCPDLDIGQREPYLQKTGWTEKYQKFMVDRITDMAKSVREQVNKINPSFKLGGSHLDELNVFTEGLARGFGTPENPVLVFSLKTYETGYVNYVDKTIEKLKNMDIHAKFIAGLWQDKFPIENLPEQYYFSAKNSDGYWIYTMQTLNPDWKGAVAYSTQMYWEAIRKANQELDKLSLNAGYESDLVLRHFQTPLPAIDLRAIRIKPLEYVRPSAEVRNEESPRVRRSNKLVFVAQKGDTIKFKIEFTGSQSSDTNYTQVSLLTNTAQVLAEDNAATAKNAVVETAAPYTGSYCIVLNSAKLNTAKIISSSHPYSIEAFEYGNVHLYKYEGPLYFWKPADSKISKIDFLVNGPSEGVVATFKTESGELIGQYNIDSKKQIILPLQESKQGQIIVMQMEAMPFATYRDVIVTVKEGLGKYVSHTKAGLVKTVSIPAHSHQGN